MEQTDRMDCRGTGSDKEASWESGVRRVVPYTPGEQPRRAGIIKLNTNECPYPPSPQVKRLAAELETDVLRLYPDPEASLLVKSIAAHFGVGEDQVFVGVGSDDVLAMALIRISPFCFRISPIPFMMYGRICSESPSSARPWMRISGW